MKACLLLLVLVLAIPCLAGAQEEAPAPVHVDATAIMQQLLSHRATKDFSLKARLFVDKDIIPVEMLVHNATNETRTIYRTGPTELLVVQPVDGATRWFLKGAGELTGARRMERLAGSQFTYYDLGMPFLHWPTVKYVGPGRVRGQDCYDIELTATNQPYSKVDVWIDQKYYALLRAEAYDENEGLARRLSIGSFKRLGDLWIPKGIDMAFILPSQALPSEEKSRLDVYDGNYETHLPAEMFDEAKFGATK